MAAVEQNAPELRLMEECGLEGNTSDDQGAHRASNASTRAPTCAGTTKAGAPCRMPALTGTTTCVNHSPGSQALQRRAVEASAAARTARRRERIERRERSAADWIAVALERRGEEIAEAVAQAAVDGDWRAAQALWERVYGRPVERVEAVQVDVDLRTLTDAQLEAMRAQLLRGTTVGTTPSQSP